MVASWCPREPCYEKVQNSWFFLCISWHFMTGWLLSFTLRTSREQIARDVVHTR